MHEHALVSYAGTAASLDEMRGVLKRVRFSRSDAMEEISRGTLGEAVALLKERYARARVDRAELDRADAAATVVLRLLAHCAMVATPIAAAGSASRSFPAPAARCVSVALNALRSCCAAMHEIKRRCRAQPWLAVCCAACDATHALDSLRTAAALRNATPPRWAAFSASTSRSVFESVKKTESTSSAAVHPCSLAALRQRIESQTQRIADTAPTGEHGVRADAAARRASLVAIGTRSFPQGSTMQRSSHATLRVDVTGLDTDSGRDTAESTASSLSRAMSGAGARPLSYVMETAAALHQTWQEKRPMTPRGSRRKTRMKTVGDVRRGWVTIDVANTQFALLPAELQSSFVRSAKVACDEVVAQSAVDSLRMDRAFVERSAARVHDAWVNREGSRAEAEQLVPYAVLRLAQQQRCRDIVHLAISVHIRRHARNNDPVTKLQARWRAMKERRRLSALGAKLEEGEAQGVRRRRRSSRRRLSALGGKLEEGEAQGVRRHRRSSLGRLLRSQSVSLLRPDHSASPGGRRQSFSSLLRSPRAAVFSLGTLTPRGKGLTPRGSRRKKSYLGARPSSS